MNPDPTQELQTQMTKNLLLERCPYCGQNQHEAICPRIKAIEHHPDGKISRVEFFTPAEMEDRAKRQEIEELKRQLALSEARECRRKIREPDKPPGSDEWSDSVQDRLKRAWIESRKRMLKTTYEDQVTPTQDRPDYWTAKR